VRALALTLLLTLLPAAALGQPPAKVPSVGILMSTTPAATKHISDAFAAGLTQDGWIPGRTVTLEYRWAEGRVDRFPDLAAELVGRRVDVIVASGIDATEAARKATASTPIVMVNVTDPVGAGLVQNLVRPGGTVTGLASPITPSIRGKQLQLLREALPRTRQIAILRNAEVAGAAVWKEYEAAGRVLGVETRFVDVKGPQEFDAAMARVGRTPGEALFVPSGGGVFLMNRAALVDSALRHRVPAMFTAREFTDAGGLMSYSARITDQFHRAAEYVGRVLRGRRPGEMPVEQPTGFELVVNLKTATALELTLPPAFLLRADEVLR
jgi:putative tryptophan/tyrosine transport system substrate-binding protein